MSLDRRTFLKGAVVVPVAAALPGGLAALTETAPVVPAAMIVCRGGGWRGPTPGWDIQLPPVVHEFAWDVRANG